MHTHVLRVRPCDVAMIESLLSVDGDVGGEQAFAVVAAYAASAAVAHAAALHRTSGNAPSPPFRPEANFRAFHKRDLHTEQWSPA
ncbi:MAG TPA: hypothetical protein VGF19_09450 [Candidatus Acidoferrum sp.]